MIQAPVRWSFRSSFALCSLPVVFFLGPFTQQDETPFLPEKHLPASGEKTVTSTSLTKQIWDAPANWQQNTDGNSLLELKGMSDPHGDGLELNYFLKENGWVLIHHHVAETPNPQAPIVFFVKANSSATLEVKWIGGEGATFGRRILLDPYKKWTPIVLYRNNMEYWWGNNEKNDVLTHVEFAISGEGSGTVWLHEIGLGEPGLAATFLPAGPVVDKESAMPGMGFQQRRDAQLHPEDPLVLEGLKQIQDVSTPEKQLLPTMEDNQGQLFNNALVAMAFMLKGERERAERILDFFSDATDKTNRCPTLQNFFLKGEARGFFQNFSLVETGDVPAYHATGQSDRWMGDMAWLLIAYKDYEKTYHSDKYKNITALLKTLLLSYYTDNSDGKSGYVKHGWRARDSHLHESDGHPEGNIDAYAAFELCGEHEKAQKIRVWLDSVLKGNNLPLDLYTWRSLAFTPEVDLLNIPEQDRRFRKTLTVNGKQVTGLYSGADINVNNIWLDGTAHMACAYMQTSEKERGYFYANQLDHLLIDREIHGVKTRALPYTANKEGGYAWVNPEKGFISVAAWYIFAKNQFNPMKLETAK